MISLLSRNHTSIALSTIEAKYIFACSTCSEAIWLRNMLAGLFDEEIDVTNILCDNQSCIKKTKNLFSMISQNISKLHPGYGAEGSCKYQVCSYRGTSGRCLD